MYVEITLSAQDWQNIAQGLRLAASYAKPEAIGLHPLVLEDYAETLEAHSAVCRPVSELGEHVVLQARGRSSLRNEYELVLPPLCNCSECARSPDPCDWTGGL